MNENYYRILGLANYATIEEIRAAYRQLAKKYHPDRNPEKPHYEEKFKRISIAYKTLTNVDKKAAYDRQLINLNTRKHQTTPRYAPAPYYATKKREYTPKAWMYAKIFIILFIMAITLISMGLLHYSSVRYYERGMESYEKGDISRALLSFNSAMSWFGGRSVEAGIKASEIYLYEIKDYKQAKLFANRALEYAERDIDFAYLYFLRGAASYGNREPLSALADYSRADSLDYNPDSLQLKLGFLNAFELEKYNKAQKNFEYLIDKNIKPEVSWFGKAWCQQSMKLYDSALLSYQKVLNTNDSNALAYYYSAACYIQLADTANACDQLHKAITLGYTRAQPNYVFYCEGDTTSSFP